LAQSDEHDEPGAPSPRRNADFQRNPVDRGPFTRVPLMSTARSIPRFQVIHGVPAKPFSRSRLTGPVRLTCLVLAGVAMTAGLAHLFELPNKIHLTRDDYFTVQQIYRGWALLGVALLAAWGTAVWSAVLTRHTRSEFHLMVIAAVCLTVSIAVFLGFTLPANLATRNWTFVPVHWEMVRARWEYSHAVAALLDFAAFLALALSFEKARRSRFVT